MKPVRPVRRSTILHLTSWLLYKRESELLIDPKSVRSVRGFSGGEDRLIGHLILPLDGHTVEIQQKEIVPAAVSTKFIIDKKVVHTEIQSNSTALLENIHLMIERHSACKDIVGRLIPPKPDPKIIAEMEEAIGILDELGGHCAA